MRAVGLALRLAGWALLGLAALAGLALSAVALLASSEVGRPVVARTLISFADDAVAGKLELGGIAVLPGGGIELRGLRVTDPEGHLALAVDRARLFVDVTRLRNRSVGLSAEIDGPTVLLDEEDDGSYGIARAFAPAHPSPKRADEPQPASRDRGPGWTLRVQSLRIRGGQVWWRDAEGVTRFEATALDLDARALVGPDRTRLDLRALGDASAPAAGPLKLEIRAGIDGDVVRVPVFRAGVGETGLAAFGEGNLAARTARLALGRVAVDATRLGAIAPGAGLPGDVAAEGYAETDGREVTAALRVVPGAGGRGGSADVAAAARLDGARALGLDAVLDRLDPSALHRAAPPGAITLRAKGGAAGASWEALRGRATVAIAPSKLRAGAFGPGEVQARLDRGSWDVDRLALAAPGLELRGQGRWRAGGAVGGTAVLDAADLRAAARNGAALAGQPPPEVSGRARVEATLGGTAAAPTLEARVDAPAAASGALSVVGLKASASATGPLRTASGRVKATVERVRDGGVDAVRTLSFEAVLEGGEGRVDAQALVPALGPDPVSLRGRGRHVGAPAVVGGAGPAGSRGPREDQVRIEELALGYPGARWTLAAPATVTLADVAGGAPATAVKLDRLELREASGRQVLALEGGFDKRGVLLDARLEASAVDLAKLPRGLLPPGLGLAGEVSAKLAATGSRRAPRLAGTLSLAHGAYRDLDGLAVTADVGWDLAARRLSAKGGLRRDGGGAAEWTADLPVPFAGRAAEPVSARLDARALPADLLLRAAAPPAEDEPGIDLRGALSATLELSGTVGAPAIRVRASLADGGYEDLERLAAEVEASTADGKLSLEARASLAGSPALAARAGLPLDLAAFFARPGEMARGLRTAPLAGDLSVPSLDLARLAGRLGVPADLVGTASGTARLSGTLAAPRGDADLALAGGGTAGVTGVSGRATLAAAGDGVTVRVAASFPGAPFLEARAALRAAPERLFGAAAVAGGGWRTTPLDLDVRVPRFALDQARGPVPLGGTLEVHLQAQGTPASPRVTLDASGDGITVDARPLGAPRLAARSADGRVHAEATVAAASGGTLSATADVRAALGLAPPGRPAPPLAEAPAEVTLRAVALDLGVLPALLPGLVRTAGGRLDADVTAKGPLSRPSPRGTLSVSAGRLAISEYGDWTGIEVETRVTDESVEVSRLVARRGAGKVEGHLSLKGLRDASAAKPAVLEGKLASAKLPVTRAGMDLANLDLELLAAGTYHPGVLDVRVDLPHGTVRLPRRSPRTLQSLEPRPDIVVGPKVEKKRRAPAASSAASGAPAFAATLRLVSPGKLFVTSENPRLKIELKADVTYELQGGSDFMTGSVETIRGDVEPFGGRVFVVQRGRVIFTGGPPRAAMLDVEAVYTNPAAVVTVAVAGPARDPEIRLTSQPSMDEGQIALLLATGRTELKAGSGGVGTLSGEEAGKAVLGAVATQAFKELVADKLPLDQVALDSGALRAGKYVTDKIYVGYTRRFEAQPEKGENQNEVRVEYQITPRWTFESRYGDAQSGGASLIWSRDY